MSGRRLYVGRLAASANREEVEKFFSTHGKLVDIRMMVGFCFLEYEELKDAEQAVADFNGTDFMGDRLIVEFAKPPRNVDPDREPRRFDRNDPQNNNNRGNFGNNNNNVGNNNGGGYNNNGGNNNFNNNGGNQGYNNNGGGGYGGGGFNRNSNGYSAPSSRNGGHRLIVNGVPDGCSWQDLKDFARSAGTVTYADVDRNNPSIGYIEYPSRADADEAIRSLSKADLKGVAVTVEDLNRSGGGSRSDDRRGSDRRDDDRRGSDRRDDDRRSSYRDDRRDSDRRDDRRDDRRSDRDRDSRRRSRSRSRSRSPRRRSVSPAPRSSRRDDRDRSPAPAAAAAPAEKEAVVDEAW